MSTAITRRNKKIKRLESRIEKLREFAKYVKWEVEGREDQVFHTLKKASLDAISEDNQLAKGEM